MFLKSVGITFTLFIYFFGGEKVCFSVMAFAICDCYLYTQVEFAFALVLHISPFPLGVWGEWNSSYKSYMNGEKIKGNKAL